IAAGPSDFMQAVLDQNKLMVDAKLVTEAQWPFIQQQVAMLRDPSFDPKQPPKGWALGTPGYWFDLREPTAPLAAKQTVPLFIFQGARDFQVPAGSLETWQKELANRDGVAYKLYPKLNHLFSEGDGPMGWQTEYTTPANVPAYVIDDIAAWVLLKH
ncbi:MAG TPA: hypothetical protein VNT75_29160, partial [Symbiobacteriaceae bacterium]|nr:hypothetical protein [Symbiobacteriaceae bacterium]